MWGKTRKIKRPAGKGRKEEVREVREVIAKELRAEVS